jgi:hypothetical protein
MTRHVSDEDLARFRDGDLSGPQTRRVAAHLAACDRCRATNSQLAQVPALLAAVDMPPMPAHLEARIETALAAESAQRAARDPEPVPARSRPVAHTRRRRRPTGSPFPAVRILAAAAGIAVVVGGIDLVAHLGGGSAAGSSGTSAAAPAASGRHSLSGRHSTAAEAGPTRLQYTINGRSASVQPVRSGTDFRAATLGSQAATALVSRSKGTFGASGMTPNLLPHGTNGPLVQQDIHLAGCVNRIAAGHQVLLVDLAQFKGKPATVIVTAGSGSADQVWVAGLACSASASDLLAHRALPRR